VGLLEVPHPVDMRLDLDVPLDRLQHVEPSALDPGAVLLLGDDVGVARCQPSRLLIRRARC
jgi:hypothetical protein